MSGLRQRLTLRLILCLVIVVALSARCYNHYLTVRIASNSDYAKYSNLFELKGLTTIAALGPLLSVIVERTRLELAKHSLTVSHPHLRPPLPEVLSDNQHQSYIRVVRKSTTYANNY